MKPARLTKRQRFRGTLIAGATDPTYLHNPTLRDAISYIQPSTSISRTRLSIEFPLHSSGGGTIFSSHPITVSGIGEFSAYQAIYDEYRIMGGLITIASTTPLVTSSSSPENGLVHICYDFNDASPPTAVVDVLNFGNRRSFQAISTSLEPFRYSFVVPVTGGSTAVPWTGTATTPVFGSIKIGVGGLTASRAYFDCVLDMYVQFRGRV